MHPLSFEAIEDLNYDIGRAICGGGELAKCPHCDDFHEVAKCDDCGEYHVVGV